MTMASEDDKDVIKKAYVSLGSNIEPRMYYINKALRRLNDGSKMRVVKRSSVFETFPEGSSFDRDSRFLNSVAELETVLGPRQLLIELLSIEKSLGRIRSEKDRSRTIDLDILLYGDLIVDEAGLSIPHPRMLNRNFIMTPLNEIAPSLRHPVEKKSIADIYRARGMKIFKDPKKIHRYINREKTAGKRIGFVPTMGCLHEGHISLIKKARRETDIVVLSIFVNPAQFGPKEDYLRYPRDFKRDSAIASKEGVDIIFYPSADTMYKKGHSTYVDLDGLNDKLCGRYRKGHFRGVATIVTKLFNIVRADCAYFGQKDAQQALIIKKIAGELNMSTVIRVLPTAREADGLARSSRNSYLSEKERLKAAVGYKSLKFARDMISKGERDSHKIIREMKKKFKNLPGVRAQYISIVDTHDLKDISRLRGKVLIAIAFYVGKTRLIDNLILNVRTLGTSMRRN